jgi:hypothetical protein
LPAAFFSSVLVTRACGRPGVVAFEKGGQRQLILGVSHHLLASDIVKSEDNKHGMKTDQQHEFRHDFSKEREDLQSIITQNQNFSKSVE